MDGVGARESDARDRATCPDNAEPNHVFIAGGIHAPTLLITGDADLYESPIVLRLFSARIKNSESVLVPEAALCVLGQPEIFTRRSGFYGGTSPS